MAINKAEELADEACRDESAPIVTRVYDAKHGKYEGNLDGHKTAVDGKPPETIPTPFNVSRGK